MHMENVDRYCILFDRMSNGSPILSVIILALLYFVLAVAAAMLVLLPDLRQRSLDYLQGALGTIGVRFRRRVAAIQSDAAELRSAGTREAGYWLGIARRYQLLLAGAGVVLFVPVAVALIFQRHVEIGGFEERTQPTDPVILSLLQGEQLVPPVPLPPDVFTTREVELIRPALGSASRDWDLVDADFRQRLLAVFRIMRGHGYEMALLEGYRSPERQNYLASLGSHVTNASAFQSYHQFGLAADCAFYVNGRIVIDERDPWAMRGYRLYGEAAESAGLTWGGRWKMMDFGHVQLARAGTLVRK